MRGNHHKQETALFVLLLIHYGVYPDVPVKLADLGHKRIMEGKIQEAQRKAEEWKTKDRKESKHEVLTQKQTNCMMEQKDQRQPHINENFNL